MIQVSMWVTVMAWSAPPPSPVPARGEQAWLGEAEELRPAVKSLVARVLGLGREHPDVEDCTHEAFRRALEGRSQLQQGLPVRPWLLGIARHVAIDLLRARRRRGPFEVPNGADSHDDVPVDPELAPDAQLEQAERAQRLSRALDELDEAPRRALLLFHVEGLGYREIAERMNAPIGTVGTWIARGRRSLAAVLANGEP
jgi:RNA polymerase sigma-70 factor, ECF subfamily